jgi:hypothetical protein
MMDQRVTVSGRAMQFSNTFRCDEQFAAAKRRHDTYIEELASLRAQLREVNNLSNSVAAIQEVTTAESIATNPTYQDTGEYIRLRNDLSNLRDVNLRSRLPTGWARILRAFSVQVLDNLVDMRSLRRELADTVDSTVNGPEKVYTFHELYRQLVALEERVSGERTFTESLQNELRNVTFRNNGYEERIRILCEEQADSHQAQKGPPQQVEGYAVQTVTTEVRDLKDQLLLVQGEADCLRNILAIERKEAEEREDVVNSANLTIQQLKVDLAAAEERTVQSDRYLKECESHSRYTHQLLIMSKAALSMEKNQRQIGDAVLLSERLAQAHNDIIMKTTLKLFILWAYRSHLKLNSGVRTLASELKCLHDVVRVQEIDVKSLRERVEQDEAIIKELKHSHNESNRQISELAENLKEHKRLLSLQRLETRKAVTEATSSKDVYVSEQKLGTARLKEISSLQKQAEESSNALKRLQKEQVKQDSLLKARLEEEQMA